MPLICAWYLAEPGYIAVPTLDGQRGAQLHIHKDEPSPPSPHASVRPGTRRRGRPASGLRQAACEALDSAESE